MSKSAQTNTTSTQENQFKCGYCQSVHPLYTVKQTSYYACSDCGTNFVYAQNRWNDLQSDSEYEYTPSQIKLGDKAVFNSITYQVIGISLKRHRKWRFTWKEYILFNSDTKSYRTLTERKGHWNLYTHVEDGHPKSYMQAWAEFDHKGETYKKYDRYYCDILWTAGEFHWDFRDEEKPRYTEFIAPPHTYLLDVTNDGLRWFKGIYLTHNEVRSAFNISVPLPTKEGMDPAMPLNLPIKNSHLATYLGAFIFALLIAGISLGLYQPSKNMLITTDLLPKAKGENILKDSLYIEGGIFGWNNLKVNLNTDVKNAWFETTIVLHDITRNQYYGKKVAVEYYSGVTDGVSWSEGGNGKSIVFPHLLEGPYNILVYDAFSKLPKTKASLKVEQGIFVWSNILTIFLMAFIYPVIQYLYRNMKENERWEDSEFSH